jgi:hypothetical protein
MDVGVVPRWVDAYVEPWNTGNPDLIADLFMEDGTYAYHPWDEPLAGRTAIGADWLTDPDEPRSWEADYKPMLSKEIGQ